MPFIEQTRTAHIELSESDIDFCVSFAYLIV